MLLETASSLRFSVEIADSVLRFSPKVCHSVIMRSK